MVSFTACLRLGAADTTVDTSANTSQTQPNLFKQLRQDNFQKFPQTLKNNCFELSKKKKKIFK